MSEINECVGPESPMSEVPPSPDDGPKRSVKVRLSLFFDGTGNNRVNTNHRLKAEEFVTTPETLKSQKVLDEYADEGSSYYNDHSNVSRLENHIEKSAAGYDYYFSIYTEGIGTVDSDSDTFLGNVMGKGGAGVKGKVNKGLLTGISTIQEMIPRKEIIELLTVDTFGFSRGAAAARYCVYRVLHSEAQPYPNQPKRPLKARLKALGRQVDKVEVKTVGVFDTVSALGIAYIDMSDVAALHLDAIREAQAVLHLAAAEEYRICFSLTNIDSAVSSGKGWEVFLPGAHSDIGGGYVHEAGEAQKEVYTGDAASSIAEYLTENGWYEGDELYQYPSDKGRSPRILVNRSNISNQYSFIPLRLMADYAKEQGLGVKDKLYAKYDPKDVPAEVRGRIEAYGAARGPSKASDWHSNDPALRTLRHRCLHLSSQNSMGYHMRLIREDRAARPFRKVYSG